MSRCVYILIFMSLVSLKNIPTFKKCMSVTIKIRNKIIGIVGKINNQLCTKIIVDTHFRL
jgi:hypothetical protein